MSALDSGDETFARDLLTEIAARMPWLSAEPESWWVVSGSEGPKDSFTTCLARVLPQEISASSDPIFEVLIYGGSHYVSAASITAAKELMFVYTEDPVTAYYSDDQPILDRAHGVQS